MPRFKGLLLTSTLILALHPAQFSRAQSVPFTVWPTELELTGNRDPQRLLVTGHHRENREADLTRKATYESLDPNIIAVSPTGLVSPRGNGKSAIVVRIAGQEQRVKVRVRSHESNRPVDFRNEVIAALGRGGCNQGACHGSPQGKGGFRLSLRGFDPELDLMTLTRETYGRRTDSFAPDSSLILEKATVRVPHEGGRRFQEHDVAYQLLQSWIKQGCRASAAKVELKDVEVFPRRRYLNAANPVQQFAVRARYSDGSIRDVTELSVFSSSNEADAPILGGGLVSFKRTAEAVILVRYLERIISCPLTYVKTDPAYVANPPAAANEVDHYVFEKQRELQLHTASIAEDSVFLRRIYLDLIGALPSPAEATRFLDSSDPQKRANLIDALLNRPEFATFWALKWADIMRGNRETITERGVHNFHRYLVTLFAEDRPFDKFAREILTSQGNTIHKPSANFYRIARTPEDAAESTAQLFLGVRIQCAKCHNHPFEALTQKDYYGLAACFARVRLKGQRFGLDDEVVYIADDGEVTNPTAKAVQVPLAFGKPIDSSDPNEDRRRGLADWMVQPSNPFFARAMANRVWSHLMGKGIVEPIDDFRESNPPSNPDLLDALVKHFIAGGYRVKPLIRLIANSSTYQLSASPPTIRFPNGADPERYFTSATIRMLTAEQILDAISAAAGIPETFPGYPKGTRAIDIAEGETTHQFLKAFTKPVRNDACDCARETEPSLNQVIHLVNNANILAKIESTENRLAQAYLEGKTSPELVDLTFLATLSRRPTKPESALAIAHLAKTADRMAGLRDLQHALINTNEFLLRH